MCVGGRQGAAWEAPTAFGLEVGDAMHDDVVQEERLVVHFDAAGEESAEVMDVPTGHTGRSGARSTTENSPCPLLHSTTLATEVKCTPGPTSSGMAAPLAPPCPRRSASWQTCPAPGWHYRDRRAR